MFDDTGDGDDVCECECGERNEGLRLERERESKILGFEKLISGRA